MGNHFTRAKTFFPSAPQELNRGHSRPASNGTSPNYEIVSWYLVYNNSSHFDQDLAILQGASSLHSLSPCTCVDSRGGV